MPAIRVNVFSSSLPMDLTGQRSGRLAALDFNYFHPTRGIQWLARCDCGKEKFVTITNFHSTESCGCIRRKAAKEEFRVEILSALWDWPETKALASRYRGMRSRCYNPYSASFKRYGGRGITICKEWLGDFDAFVTWSVENGFRRDLTIDRIDNDGPYSPDNCRWITMEDNVSAMHDHHRARKRLLP